MSKVDKLVELAVSIGLDIDVFEFITANHVRVKYSSLKQGGPLPVLEFCRDKLDYDLKMAAWHKASINTSPEYPNFDAMISGELKRLKVWAKTLKK